MTAIATRHSPAYAIDEEAIRRRQELARLVPLWPAELFDLSIEGRARLVAKLQRALRAERRRGLAGHFAYDLSRHAQLLRSTRAEAAALNALILHRSGLAGASNKGEASPPRPR